MSEKEISIDGIKKFDEMRNEIPALVEMDNKIADFAVRLAMTQDAVDLIFPGHKMRIVQDDENPYLLKAVIDFGDYSPIFTGDEDER